MNRCLYLHNSWLKNVSLFGLVVIFCGSAVLLDCSKADGQEVRKALNDYRRERPFQYQPSDPWTRSKLFQTQTKHYGLFYNCDNEECKRNHPAICWKTHFERDLPTWMTWRQRIQYEANQVKQRILDGAGMCASGCDGSQCQSAATVAPCDCATCQAMGRSNGVAASETRIAQATKGTKSFKSGARINQSRVAQQLTRTAQVKQVANQKPEPKVARAGLIRTAAPRSETLVGSNQAARVADRTTTTKSESLIERVRRLKR